MRLGDLAAYFVSPERRTCSSTDRTPTRAAPATAAPWVYVFETPDGTILYQDTSGHWRRHPAATCAPMSRSSRQPDGATSTASRSRERSRSSSPLLQARSSKACQKQVILCHHDDWLPGFSTAYDTDPIREELARFAPGA